MLCDLSSLTLDLLQFDIESLLCVVMYETSVFFKYFTRDVYVDTERPIKCWKSSSSASASRNYLKATSTLRDGAFSHNLSHISETVIGSS